MNSGQFFRRLLYGDYQPVGIWVRLNHLLLAHISPYRRWYLRREKARLIKAAQEIQQAQIDSIRKGLALLESLEPYTRRNP